MAKRVVSVRLDDELLARVDARGGSRTEAIEAGLWLLLGGVGRDPTPARDLGSLRASRVERLAVGGRVVGRLASSAEAKRFADPRPKGSA